MVIAENAVAFTAPASHPHIAEPFDMLKGALKTLFGDIDNAPLFRLSHGFTIMKTLGFNFSAFIFSRIQRGIEPLLVQVN